MNQYINPRNKLLHHPERLAALKAGQIAAPINVEIDLSNRCSLGCEWCHFGYTHTRGPLAGKREKPEQALPGGDLMSRELIIKTLSELNQAGVRSVTWTGGGEPTLHPEFNHVIKYVAWETELDQGLYTNGGHIDAERAYLLKQHATWVYVSLDCADRVDYLAEKKVDYFDRVCEGVRRLADADGTATIGIGFLIHSGNYTRAHDMRDLGLGLGANFVQFRPAVYFDMQQPGKVVGDTNWIDAALIELQAVAQSPKAQVEFDRFQMLREWQEHGYGMCYWAGLQTCITPDGSVWTCVNKREHAAAKLGNLAAESFEDIWKRGGAKMVDESCRVLCRGHVPNVALHQMFEDVPHRNFI